MTDSELLEQYAQTNSEPAFAELVRRHVDWVYCSARRQVRDAHLAEDVTQSVFIALARESKRLGRRAALSTWLFQVVRYASAKAMRDAIRRKRREQKVAVMRAQSTPAASDDQWEQLAPILDELVGKLGKKDREAILLRFYQQKTFAEAAEAMGISETAAAKRTGRAVDKLRKMFIARGAAVTASGVLAAGLLANTTRPASAALGAAATRSALAAAQGEMVATHILAMAKGALHMMTWSKAAVLACVLLVVSMGAGLGFLERLLWAQNQPAAQNAPSTQPAPRAQIDVARWQPRLDRAMEFDVMQMDMIVTDVEASLDFYSKLGFTLASYKYPQPGQRLEMATMSTCSADRPRPTPYDFVRLVFRKGTLNDADRQAFRNWKLRFGIEGGTEAMEKYRERLRQDGIKVSEYDDSDSPLRTFHVQDPDGRTIGFVTNRR